MKSYHFDTLQVHAGNDYNTAEGSCATPIHQTASFRFKSAEHARRLFSLQENGNIYTRLSNPTVEIFEKRITALEGGSASVATSSGQAAQFIAIQNIAEKGDNIVCSSSLYGGTYSQFRHSLARFGVEVRFTRGDHFPDSLFDQNTKALYIETIGNSDLFIPDFEAIADLCRKKQIPMIIDNTFGAAGYLFRPLEWGANIVTASATKWIGGHGNSIAGVLTDCANFDWGCGKFRQFTEPSPSYHGLSFWEQFGAASPSGNIAFAVKARAEGLRDWGCSLSPFNAFLLLQGVETLSLRIDRTVSNAQELSEWLLSHPTVESVNYPGLKSNPNYDNAKKYFKRGFGGVIYFTLKGGRDKCSKLTESLDLITHLVNIGDCKTLISHPASTTHAQLNSSELEAAGIKENMLRISLGIEHIEDIKSDLEQALKRI
ncbi:MAG: PLP-dependent transferase [Bacteroidales bacterium]|nr:PLP-dependent transferase [Bacteroidales bacterium]MDD2425384.1 PLP-dependent transferase [Bacteroidales bacterium]MDD3988801.1 PLP-dependent transferase [Bacteroidales bacterium]MDD4638991.1 PLP-dependent transferase [Bacteroidales bacterium]